jgi:hypothetical protein
MSRHETSEQKRDRYAARIAAETGMRVENIKVVIDLLEAAREAKRAERKARKQQREARAQ